MRMCTWAACTNRTPSSRARYKKKPRAGARSRSARSMASRGNSSCWGSPFSVGVHEGFHHDLEPGVELVVADAADLHPGRRDRLGLNRQTAAEHVFERDEPVAPFGQ